jgi:hypothetical protein
MWAEIPNLVRALQNNEIASKPYQNQMGTVQ